MSVLVEDYEFWLLDLYLQPIRKLAATSGRITGNVNAQIRWSGETTITETSITSTAWNDYRIQVKRIDLTDPASPMASSLGVFAVTSTKNQDGGSENDTTQQLQFYDLTSFLADSATAQTLTIPAGTDVIAQVQQLCSEVAALQVIVDPDAGMERLRSPLTFEPGTTRLKIVNELLRAGGFFAIYTDSLGRLRCSKYAPPEKRPIVYTFKDNALNKRHLPGLAWDEEILRPNEVICHSTSTGDKPGMIAIARNENPESPYSYQRQHRWITRSEQNVEATSQAVLDAYAQRLLQTGVSGKVYKRDMLYTPLELNAVVRGEDDGLEVVENLSLDCTPGALLQVTSRQVGV